MSAPETSYWRQLSMSALMLLLSGCAAYSVINSDRYSSNAAIPHHERPPVGQCRLWYDDRPDSEQPPAGDCERLQRQQPDNARLIYG